MFLISYLIIHVFILVLYVPGRPVGMYHQLTLAKYIISPKHMLFLLFQRHLSKKTVQSKIVFSKKPIKVYEDKPNSLTPSRETTHEMSVQASPQQAEAEVQTDVSEFQKQLADAHNDSGVGTGDIDQEAYDLMVKGKP